MPELFIGLGALSAITSLIFVVAFCLLDIPPARPYTTVVNCLQFAALLFLVAAVVAL